MGGVVSFSAIVRSCYCVGMPQMGFGWGVEVYRIGGDYTIPKVCLSLMWSKRLHSTPVFESNLEDWVNYDLDGWRRRGRNIHGLFCA